MKNTELQPIQEQPLQGEAEMLIARAIDKNISVESLERLLAMRKELKEEKAKEDFTRAMSIFQAECPTIQKTKSVKTKTGIVAYKYAPIDSIVEQVRSSLSKNGFSYSTNMQLQPNGVKVSVKVTHIGGHSEITDMDVPLGNKTEIMSQTQVVAAAQTFAKRYAFCNAFGILTGDEDDDANSIPKVQQGAPMTPLNTSQSHTTPLSQVPVVEEYKLDLKLQKHIFALMRDAGKTQEQVHELIKKAYNQEHITKLTEDQAKAVIKKLEDIVLNQMLEEENAKKEEVIDLDEVAEGIDSKK